MLERTILLLMGLCTDLDPDLNPMEVIRPHVEEFVLGKDGDWSKFMLDTARDITLSALALPPEIKKFTSHALRGDLEIRIEGNRQRAKMLYALGHQVIYVALGIAAAHFSLRFEGHDDPWRIGLLSGAGLCGLLLLRSFWRTHRWMKRWLSRR